MLDRLRARIAAFIAPKDVGAPASDFGQKDEPTAPASAGFVHVSEDPLVVELGDTIFHEDTPEGEAAAARRIKTMQEVESERAKHLGDLADELARLTPGERERLVASTEVRRVGPAAIRARALAEIAEYHKNDKEK